MCRRVVRARRLLRCPPQVDDTCISHWGIRPPGGLGADGRQEREKEAVVVPRRSED